MPYPDGFKIEVAKTCADLVAAAIEFYEKGSGPDKVAGYAVKTHFYDDPAGKKKRRMGFIASKGAKGEDVAIAIRGTGNASDAATDLNFSKATDAHLFSDMKCHKGFLNAYLKLQAPIKETLKNIRAQGGAQNILVAGHSLGGALATLCALDLRAESFPEYKKVILYTFGAPKVFAESTAAKKFKAIVGDSYRVVNPHDSVPTVPPNFAHFAEGEWRIESKIGVKGTVAAHVMKSYRETIEEFAKTR
ncbi:MAG TPA: lipase family protein [Planctomycetota bacterium]|nr:lipase family protein [Planctomycetota bacterium]